MSPIIEMRTEEQGKESEEVGNWREKGGWRRRKKNVNNKTGATRTKSLLSMEVRHVTCPM